MKNKFKVGDTVITKQFEGENGFISKMVSCVKIPGKIEFIDTQDDGIPYQVHGYFWPESSLTLVQAAEPDPTPPQIFLKCLDLQIKAAKNPSPFLKPRTAHLVVTELEAVRDIFLECFGGEVEHG